MRGQESVLVFNESGKFILRIGKSGQGPGEYSVFLDDMIINPYTRNIDLFSGWGHIFTYDLSGKHVKTTPQFTKHSSDMSDFHAAQYFIALDEKTYIFHQGMICLRLFIMIWMK